MARLTMKNLDERLTVLENKMDRLIDLMEQRPATQSTATKSTIQSTPKTSKSTPKSTTSVNLDDYAPTDWGNGKKGYTTLRKAYSYAVCGGKDHYDEKKFREASEEFKQRYYGQF